MRVDPGARPRAYLTSDIPGLGGRLRDEPEDFVVDEIPLYTPSGEGEHLYLRIEKRDMATSYAAEQLARALNVRTRWVASAGLKDRRAVTTQWMSIHDPQRRLDPAAGELRPGLRILETGRHGNKLRRGHLRANRFTITLRGARHDADGARAVLEDLARRGVPNRAGEQRFGNRANNHLLGRALLLGDHRALLDELLGPDEAFERADDPGRRLYAEGRFDEAIDAFPRAARAERVALAALARGRTPEEACGAIDRQQRGFWLTALQSAIFNCVLDERIERGALATLEVGDIAMLFGEGRKGPTFLVSENDARDPDTIERVERLAVTATGPLWGPKMQQGAGAVAERERAALSEFGIDEDAVHAFAARAGVDIMPGARRPLRALLQDPDTEAGEDERGPFVRCRFTLSPGAFATIVMEEVMKPLNAQAG
ncbi:MAG: tRNA pseudouridine(13) synthase TruD [Phycisphaerales bacterium]